MQPTEDPLATVVKLVRERPGWSTEALAAAVQIPEDVLYVWLSRLGRSQGISLSVLHGWVPIDDPQIVGLRDPDGPPCPEPTESQLEAFRRFVDGES